MLPGAYVLTNKLTIDGEESPDVSRNIQASLVEETVDGLARCELTLSNHGESGFLYFDRKKLDFGSTIELGMALGTSETVLFQGVITGLEATYMEGGGARLTVLAEDRLQHLRLTRRTRTFEDVSDEDVMRTIAQEHSLQTAFDDLSGPTYRLLAQTNLSDLAFVRQCARRVNAEIWLDGETLHAAPRSARGGEPVALAYGGSLLDFQVRADLAHQCTDLTVSGWDPQAKEAIEETVNDDALGSELSGLSGGSSILADAFGDRRASLVHTAPLSSEEATAVAEARYLERARRFVTGTGVADGDPRIRVGTTLSLSRLGPMFDGDYYVVRTCHTTSLESGYRTEFEVERAGIG